MAEDNTRGPLAHVEDISWYHHPPNEDGICNFYLSPSVSQAYLSLLLNSEARKQQSHHNQMLQSFTSHCHYHLLSSNFLPFFSLRSSYPLSSSLRPPVILPSFSVSAAPRQQAAEPWLASQVEEATTAISDLTEPEMAAEDGPIELPFSGPSIFATTDDPTPLQLATSVLLTGAISIFLFRSIRRRAKRAKESKFRSSGVKKTLKEEALDNLKAMGTASIEAKASPSPVQALIGGVTAGVIAIILYKFTTTIEAALNRQTLSDNFSVAPPVIILTIVNGLCYLATFVFGINSIGLFLYSGQLALNSFAGDLPSEQKETVSKDQLSTTGDGAEVSGSSEDRASDETQ
ncbi:hypothetical protein SAY87_002985 [Trapa incisa]|uniref:Transmembrane protein n=2 Tax=Trapa TaxID=22665 RepID=A0AAN7QX92_TRANT|nr:hypothetical protein SAY87_002985 [Trapa incisa]KAK4779420.1 hypothetical protein SAY86_006948 [Trapa natans]